MADLKDNFREWLIQQGAKPGTITSYLSRLQKISHQNWDMLTINIIPLLVQYYELANKEYYLDRVTILQALEYFNTISDNIYKTTKSDIKLSLFDGQKDYFICDILPVFPWLFARVRLFSYFSGARWLLFCAPQHYQSLWPESR